MALRKMLGSVQDAPIQTLMALIETQSRETLTSWAVTYVEAHYLPLTPEPRLAAAVSAVKANLPLKETKKYLADARKAAQEQRDPVVQAAARAVATACGVVTTPTNALGFCFYGAAAYAYHTAGVKESAGVYDALAQEELNRLLKSLLAVAVENEPNPVSIQWGC